MTGPLGNYPHGPFLRLDDDGLAVEVTAAEIAAGQEVLDALTEAARADLDAVSFGFDPVPRRYGWREHFRMIWAGWRRRGR